MKAKEFVAALDLGTSSVTVMIASGAEGEKLHIEDFVIAKSEGMVGGEIRNIELVAKSITDAVAELEQKLSIKISDFYTGISGRHIRSVKHSYYVYVGRDGEIVQDDVQRLLESMNNVQAPEGSRILHMSAQSYMVNDRDEVIDPVGMFGNKLEGTFNFILADNEYTSRLEKALQRVGLNQKQLFINALAASDAVLLPDEKEMGVAVVEIGAGTTDVCIYHGNTVRYIGVIPIGGDAINKDIRSYGILERYVEELKVNHGSAVPELASGERRIKVPGRTSHDAKEISFQNLAAIIEARMKDIADFIVAEIKGSGYEKKLGAGLVITGGGAGLKDIEKFFKDYTGYDVRVASPDVFADGQSLEMTSDYRLTTAVGLALAALRGGTASRVERRITGTTPSAQPDAEAPKADVAQGKKERKRRRSTELDDDGFDDKPRRGWMDKVKEKFDKAFSVIDDDSEI